MPQIDRTVSRGEWYDHFWAVAKTGIDDAREGDMKTSAAEDGGIMGALALLQKWTVQMVERSYISATHGRCFMAEHVIAVDAAREELIREMDRWAAHVRTEHAQKHPGALWGTPGEDD